MAVTVANPCNGDGNGCCEDFAWPPGFRFHPTDEELVLYYLKRKICRKKRKLDIIRETDVYKWDPEELPEQSLLKTGDRQWFFFSPRDRKYPNGARSNRATRQGYWKATGKDRVVTCYSRNVGLKKTLVFYRGRAPSGERTDWVMHEYTMDEQELNRCPNVQDYYALYKVFKKSGPGPKNGEQYGAPFREEDWVDDECADSNDSVTVHCSAKQQFEAAPDHSEKIVVPVEQSVDELDELLKQILDAPEFDLSPLSDDTCIETQTQNALANSALTEVTFHESFTVLPPSDQPTDRDANFLVNQAAASIFPSNGRLEVSADNNFGEPPLTVEDFLEMDDLTESQPALTNINEAGENFQIDFVNENLSVDHFLDAEMLFHDNMFSQADMSPIGPGMENQLENQTMRYSVGHQEVAHLQMQPASSDVNYQFQPESFFGDQLSNQLEMHDQASGVFYSPLSNQGTPSTLAPGGAYEVGSSLPDGRQNLAGQQGASATNSRFTSSLWAFLDSIPSTPASASESILMSKTFERMSSFSKLRMNPKTPIVNAQNVAVNAGKAGLNRRILVLSILVALCAILLVVLTGTRKLVVRSISS